MIMIIGIDFLPALSKMYKVTCILKALYIIV